MDDSHQKDIDSLIQGLKRDVEDAQKLYSDIKSKADDIDKLYSSFEEIRVKIALQGDQVKATFDSSTTIKDDISQIKGASEESLNQIRTTLQTVEQNVKDIEDGYGAFLAIKKQIDDPSAGLQQQLNMATSLKTAIEALRKEADQHVSDITDHLATINENVQTMTHSYVEFTDIKTKIDDPTTGLKALLETATNIHSAINKIKNNSNLVYNDIQKIKIQSEELKSKASTDAKEIEELRDVSKQFTDQIGLKLKIVTDSSLADSFRTRKDELNSEATMWLISMIGCLMVSFAVAVGSFFIFPFDIKSLNTDVLVILLTRVTLTSPFIFAIGFFTVNYIRARTLLEKYAFKYAVSLSLQSYTTLLDGISNVDLLKFAISSIDKVYKEPYIEKDKNKKINLGFLNTLRLEVEDKEMHEIIDNASRKRTDAAA